MVHELLLDLNFHMKYKTAHNKRKEQERAETNKEVWDFLRRDLEQNPPNYSNVLKVFKEIRDGIKCLSGMRLLLVQYLLFLFSAENDEVCADVSNHAAIIGEIIDIDFIKDQMQKEVYGWKECQKLTSDIVSVIMKIQIPRHDEETMSLWNQINNALNQQEDQQMQSSMFCRCEFC